MAKIEDQLNDAIAKREAAKEAFRNMLAERSHISAVLAREFCLHCHDCDCEDLCPLQCNCQQTTS